MSASGGKRFLDLDLVENSFNPFAGTVETPREEKSTIDTIIEEDDSINSTVFSEHLLQEKKGSSKYGSCTERKTSDILISEIIDPGSRWRQSSSTSDYSENFSETAARSNSRDRWQASSDFGDTQNWVVYDEEELASGSNYHAHTAVKTTDENSFNLDWDCTKSKIPFTQAFQGNSLPPKDQGQLNWHSYDSQRPLSPISIGTGNRGTPLIDLGFLINGKNSHNPAVQSKSTKQCVQPDKPETLQEQRSYGSGVSVDSGVARSNLDESPCLIDFSDTECGINLESSMQEYNSVSLNKDEQVSKSPGRPALANFLLALEKQSKALNNLISPDPSVCQANSDGNYQLFQDKLEFDEKSSSEISQQKGFGYYSFSSSYENLLQETACSLAKEAIKNATAALLLEKCSGLTDIATEGRIPYSFMSESTEEKFVRTQEERTCGSDFKGGNNGYNDVSKPESRLVMSSPTDVNGTTRKTGPQRNSSSTQLGSFQATPEITNEGEELEYTSGDENSTGVLVDIGAGAESEKKHASSSESSSWEVLHLEDYRSLSFEENIALFSELAEQIQQVVNKDLQQASCPVIQIDECESNYNSDDEEMDFARYVYMNDSSQVGQIPQKTARKMSKDKNGCPVQIEITECEDMNFDSDSDSFEDLENYRSKYAVDQSVAPEEQQLVSMNSSMEASSSAEDWDARSEEVEDFVSLIIEEAKQHCMCQDMEKNMENPDMHKDSDPYQQRNQAVRPSADDTSYYSSFPSYQTTNDAPDGTADDQHSLPHYNRFNPFMDDVPTYSQPTAEYSKEQYEEPETMETDNLLADLENESEDSLESEENDDIMAMKYEYSGRGSYPEIGDDDESRSQVFQSLDRRKIIPDSNTLNLDEDLDPHTRRSTSPPGSSRISSSPPTSEGGSPPNFSDFNSSRKTSKGSSDSDPIPEYSALEELEDRRRWKSVEINHVKYRIDMDAVEPYKKVISHGGYYGDGFNAIVVFTACYLPDRRRRDYDYVMDNLFTHMMSMLELLVVEDYMIVYFHGGTPNYRLPTLRWLKRCHDLIDHRLKKNFKRLVIVHPSLWLKTVMLMVKPFISSKFYGKVEYVKELAALPDVVPTEHIFIPDEVKRFDERKKESIPASPI